METEMTNIEVRKLLKIAPAILLEIKKQLGYPKGYRIKKGDIPDIEAKIKARRNQLTNCSDDHCREVYAEMVKRGSMSIKELRQKLGIRSISSIETRLDNLQLLTYNEDNVLFPLQEVFNQWREENKGFSQSENYGRKLRRLF